MLEQGSSLTNRLSCGKQPANIRLINRQKAVRSAPHTLLKNTWLATLTGQHISASFVNPSEHQPLLVLAEDLPEGAADLAHGGEAADRVHDGGHEVVGALGDGL